MPQSKQRRPISPFDARSVLLFAALTMGGALAQAQTSPGTGTPPRYLQHSGRTPPDSHAAPGRAKDPAAAQRAAGARD